MCERYFYWLPLTHPQLGTWPTTQACALTGNPTGDLLVHRPALIPEPQQPGLNSSVSALRSCAQHPRASLRELAVSQALR